LFPANAVALNNLKVDRSSMTKNDKSSHTRWHEPTVRRPDREKLNHHRGVILWFTGLSGAGKSTLAHALEETLHQRGIRTYVLDGDNVRHGLCKDLGFSDADRTENIRRIGEVSKLMLDAGLIVLTAFISPFRKDRALARSIVAAGDFVEIYCDAELEVCEARDPKGLYKKARAGQIPQFTGISSPYEAPEQPELRLQTGRNSVEACAEQTIEYLMRNSYLPHL
jgi:adenylylsulfate kinase